MPPDNPRFFTERARELDAELAEPRQRIKELQAQLASLDEVEKTRADQARQHVDRSPNPQYVAVQARVAELQREISVSCSEGRMTEKHPKIVKLQQTLEQARQELTATPAELVVASPAAVAADDSPRRERARAEAQLDRAKTELAGKQQERQRLDKAQANVMPVTQEYQRLSNQLASAEDEAAMWRKNLGRMQIALEAERTGPRTNLAIAQSAQPAYRPSWPPLWMVFGLALGGGAIFAVMCVLGLWRLSRSFGAPEQVRQVLGLPLLGVVGPVLSPAARRLRAIRRYVLAPALATLLVAATTIAATGVVMSMQCPGTYAELLEHVSPTAQAFLSGARNLLGMS
jgi:hypothetical protein